MIDNPCPGCDRVNETHTKYCLARQADRRLLHEIYNGSGVTEYWREKLAEHLKLKYQPLRAEPQPETAYVYDPAEPMDDPTGFFC